MALRELRLVRGQFLLALLELPRARVYLARLLGLRLLAGAQFLVAALRVALRPREPLLALADTADALLCVGLAVLERALPLVDPAAFVRRLARLALGGRPHPVRALLQRREPLASLFDRLLVVLQAPLALAQLLLDRLQLLVALGQVDRVARAAAFMRQLAFVGVDLLRKRPLQVLLAADRAAQLGLELRPVLARHGLWRGRRLDGRGR